MVHYASGSPRCVSSNRFCPIRPDHHSFFVQLSIDECFFVSARFVENKGECVVVMGSPVVQVGYNMKPHVAT